MARLSGMFMPMLQLLVGLTFLMVLWTGGKRLMAGEISMGSFVMFNTYMGILVWPMVAFGWVVNLFERGRASLERLREYMGETPSIRAPEKPARLPAEALGLEFRDVRIAFDGREALSGVSLYIPPGSTVAIVGRTGCGKSTLVQLIPRLLDPTSGQVLLDGIDLRDLDPAEVRHRIGFVPQETFLFSASLADNIAFGVRVASEHQIRQAAGMAGLAADIESFPDGYGTMVGERGLTLSGGQKQRTAIARALMRDPRILVLDDALSSVDTQTEENILTSLRGFMQGRTTVLISHRVSTARQADRIYVLDAGRIVEQGSHSELLDLGGYYAGLYQKQLLEEELESI
jgi:ATP-binding cassette subfamily B protein